MLREFGGVNTYLEEVDFNEHFEEYYDSDDRVVYFSKKTFRHEEGDLTFNYKYAIVVTDVGVYTEDGGAPILVELMLVPSFNDLAEKNKKNIQIYNGYGDDDEIIENWLWMDVLDYSFAVKMGEKSVNNPIEDERDEWIESEPIKAILESVVAVYEVIDRMRGFYLYKEWNRIGTTGWDILNNAINNEPLFKF